MNAAPTNTSTSAPTVSGHANQGTGLSNPATLSRTVAVITVVGFLALLIIFGATLQICRRRNQTIKRAAAAEKNNLDNYDSRALPDLPMQPETEADIDLEAGLGPKHYNPDIPRSRPWRAADARPWRTSTGPIPSAGPKDPHASPHVSPSGSGASNCWPVRPDAVDAESSKPAAGDRIIPGTAHHDNSSRRLTASSIISVNRESMVVSTGV